MDALQHGVVPRNLPYTRLEERCEAVRPVITAGPCGWLQESIDDASIWFADGRLGDWALNALAKGVGSTVTSSSGSGARSGARHLLQADSTQSAHVRLDLSPLRLAQAQLDEDPSVPGARELVRRRAGRRQVLVDRVAGVGVLHRVPRDCRRLFACSC